MRLTVAAIDSPLADVMQAEPIDHLRLNFTRFGHRIALISISSTVSQAASTVVRFSYVTASKFPHYPGEIFEESLGPFAALRVKIARPAVAYTGIYA